MDQGNFRVYGTKSIVPFGARLSPLNSTWRAANYLAAGQIYLRSNPLLRRPLERDDIKPRPVGHWGTAPGLNLIYAHANRLIVEYGLNAIFVAGPGHGAPAIVANCAVLPILHLNESKISGPTVLGRMETPQLVDLFLGYGYHPFLIEGDDAARSHLDLSLTLDMAITTIHKLQHEARENRDIRTARWPVIILDTPKGWTGSKTIDGHKVEESFHAQQTPIENTRTDRRYLQRLEEWLWSYRPDELFDDSGLNADHQNFRIFSPDETSSNRLDSVFEGADRRLTTEVTPADEQVSDEGRIMEVLSEHLCQGWLEGYLLTGRHGQSR